jgi:hypothetical protein
VRSDYCIARTGGSLPGVSSLRHEHLVRINDPANVVGGWLTREQLWEALRQTILAPKSCDASIDAAVIRELEPNRLEREIRRGRATMIDCVELSKDERLTIHADRMSVFAGSSLTMQIEEPAPGMLFVRFTYELHGLEDDRTEEEDQARRSAYQQSDIERVRQARKFAHADEARH